MENLFDIRPCGLEDIAAVRRLEGEVLASLERADQLRRNSEEMWRVCLQEPHLCLGAWARGDGVGQDAALVALAVLFVPTEGDGEALAPLLQAVEAKGLQAANFKICMVHPRWRGHGLQVTLGRMLHAEAQRRGIRLLCATASPQNPASVRSLQKLGYTPDRTLTKYGFERTLFYHFN